MRFLAASAGSVGDALVEVSSSAVLSSLASPALLNRLELLAQKELALLLAHFFVDFAPDIGLQARHVELFFSSTSTFPCAFSAERFSTSCKACFEAVEAGAKSVSCDVHSPEAIEENFSSSEYNG